MSVVTTWLEDAFTAAPVFLQQPWLQAFRAQQFEKFLVRGLPTRQEERWKYTDVAYLEKMYFSTPDIFSKERAYSDEYKNSIKVLPCSETLLKASLTPHFASAPQQVWDKLFLTREEEASASVLLVFKNGHFSPEMSNTSLLPPEVILSPLSLAIQTHESLVKPYLLQQLDGQRYPFTYLNSALMTDGVFLQIPNNFVVPYPIHLFFLNSGQNKFISCPRNIILAHEGAQVKIIEEYIGAEAEQYFTNGVTDLHAYQNARVDYYKLQSEHVTATHIATIRVQQKQNSHVNTFFVEDGGFLAREDLTVHLHESGAACHMNGLYLVKHDEQQVDNHIYVDHAATHCTSAMLYKGILNNKSRAVFNGKVYAHTGAQKTCAQQANHNLLLSPHAEVNTKPELEIYAEDVKCMHGATVGQLDADALFYLRARGIEKEEALKLLAQAFTTEIMDKITDPVIRNYIQKRVNNYAEL